MDALTLIREELTAAHEWLEGTIADVTPEQAQFTDIAKATPVGAAYAHVVVSEDMLVRGMLQGATPLYASTWAGRTGLSEPHPGPDSGDWGAAYGAWTRRVKVDLPALREYAKAVYADTDQYLASLTPEALDTPIDLSGMGMGKASLGWFLGNMVVGHVHQMTGEISAIKGIQGTRGYPF